MSEGKTEVTLAGDREIVMTRLFDAPRELVYTVFTDPRHTSQWWGPRGFRTTTHRIDVKPGGEWRYVMHGPDGHDYENKVTYLEVVRPEKLVYKHGGDKDTEPVNFHVTVTFDEVGAGKTAKTRLTMRSVFPSADARQFVIDTYGALEGGKQTLERLGEHLAGLASAGGQGTAADAAVARGGPGGSDFVISRVFNAPQDVVFKAWTQRDQLKQWFGPKGTQIASCALDLRPGGTFHYLMRSPDGEGMWGRWAFREIIVPERLVFVVSFSDEQGGVARHPSAPDWPLEMLSTVTFAAHAGIGRGTVVTVCWAALNATETEQRVFEAGHASMQQGWTGTFEQLADYLARSSSPGR